MNIHGNGEGRVVPNVDATLKKVKCETEQEKEIERGTKFEFQ